MLLRFIDGFKSTDSIVVAATNRKQDLDAALLSRCQAIVTFGLPDEACRADILKHYAAHLAAEVRLLLVLQQLDTCGISDIARTGQRQSVEIPLCNGSHANTTLCSISDLRACDPAGVSVGQHRVCMQLGRWRQGQQCWSDCRTSRGSRKQRQECLQEICVRFAKLLSGSGLQASFVAQFQKTPFPQRAPTCSPLKPASYHYGTMQPCPRLLLN